MAIKPILPRLAVTCWSVSQCWFKKRYAALTRAARRAQQRVAISEILERISECRRKRTYPRVIKKYKGRAYLILASTLSGDSAD
jgi:hypothetical protein